MYRLVTLRTNKFLIFIRIDGFCLLYLIQYVFGSQLDINDYQTDASFDVEMVTAKFIVIIDRQLIPLAAP